MHGVVLSLCCTEENVGTTETSCLVSKISVNQNISETSYMLILFVHLKSAGQLRAHAWIIQGIHIKLQNTRQLYHMETGLRSCQIFAVALFALAWNFFSSKTNIAILKL